MPSLVYPIKTKAHVVQDRPRVLAAVDQMWEDVAGIIVTSQTLEGTPNTGQR